MDRLFELLLGMLMGYLLLWAGVSAVVEKDCLDQGFPESRVSWNLAGYCVNIEGAVEGTVKKLEE